MSKKNMENCFFCNKEHQFGPHIYDGKFINQYKIQVCSSCYEGNWDGWAPKFERKLIPHLNHDGIDIPERNKKGYLPRGS